MDSIFNSLSNSESVTSKLCLQLNVPVTKTTIQKQLQEHPDYPGILSICDVLSNFGIENITGRFSSDKLAKIPTPFITQIKEENNYSSLYTIVKEIRENKVQFFDSKKNRWLTCSCEVFFKRYEGLVLMAEATESAGEKDYQKHLREEKRISFAKTASLLVMPILAVLACVITFLNNGVATLYSIYYTLLTLVGVSVGALLLWYQIDQHNPALQQICNGGKKTNCNAILNSDASNIFGVSWSVIGFTYFVGGLISLLVSGIYNIPIIFILSWLNVFTLPYIVFSIYYQARIAKQWCPMCLAVQAILVSQFAVALLGRFHTTVLIRDISSATIFTILFSFAMPFLVVSSLLPSLRKAKESKQNKSELQRLKHNPQIFEALLAKQKPITESINGLGITLGNLDPKYKLIKVCNPYCGPCAKAHPIMEALLENNQNVQVQIIFTATDGEKDFKAPPVKHLLAIAEKGNETQIKQALDDWYMAEKKDYEVFAAKYPMNGELRQQNDKLKAMREWCNKTEIAFTPTFFVNGYQLPEQYSIADLKYFLTV